MEAPCYVIPGCFSRFVSSWKPGVSFSPTVLLVASPGLLQPVEERRPVVVARCLDLRKQTKLGAESNFCQKLTALKYCHMY